MSTFILTDTPFTDTTIPVLRRDPAITDSTLFCFEVLDPYTWSSQSGAVIGSALVDLAERANADVSGGTLSWANGFVFGADSFAGIKLPLSSLLASDATAFGLTVWAKFGDLSGTMDSVVSMGKSGSGYSNTQYLIITNLSELRTYANGSSAALSPAAAITTNTLYQIGITIEKSGSNYVTKSWLNGVLVATATTVGPMASALTEVQARVGRGDIFGSPPPNMKIFRCMASRLAAVSAAEFIAADYAVGAARGFA